MTCEVDPLDDQLSAWRNAPVGAKPLVIGFTDLHNCSKEGDLSCVKRFSDKPEYWDCHDDLGCTPQLLAITFDQVDCALEMLKWDIDVKAVHCRKWSLLQQASLDGYAEVIDALVLKGARVDETAYHGGSQRPLTLAALAGHVEVVKVLLKHGADPRLRDSWELTALDCAAAAGCSSTSHHLS
jgi:ankyrin repeat protein